MPEQDFGHRTLQEIERPMQNLRLVMRVWGRSGGRRCSVFLILLLLGVPRGYAQQGWRDVRVLESVSAGHINWTEGIVVSRERSARRPDAAALAITAARQRVLRALGEVRLDTSRTLQAAWQENAMLQQAAASLAAAAEEYESHYFPGGTVESAVQVPLRGGLLEALMAPHQPPQLPASEAAPAVVYSGIVIDARGLAIQPALLPRILDETGQILYAPQLVDVTVAAQRGYIAYAHNFEHELAQLRIGANPLVIRARRVEGAARVDLVVRDLDANQLRAYAALRQLLQRCQVLIVL